MKKTDLYENTGLSVSLIENIGVISARHGVEKVVLFGSRARGTYEEKSDIDIAVYGCSEMDEYLNDLEENLWTLLELDVIDMDSGSISGHLLEEIMRDERTIYEKI